MVKDKRRYQASNPPIDLDWLIQRGFFYFSRFPNKVHIKRMRTSNGLTDARYYQGMFGGSQHGQHCCQSALFVVSFKMLLRLYINWSGNKPWRIKRSHKIMQHYMFSLGKYTCTINKWLVYVYIPRWIWPVVILHGIDRNWSAVDHIGSKTFRSWLDNRKFLPIVFYLIE